MPSPITWPSWLQGTDCLDLSTLKPAKLLMARCKSIFSASRPEIPPVAAWA
jgi:hypothetical protein